MVRGLAVWLLIMLVETLHGILRGLFLVPLTGAETAGRIGWPVGALLVLAIATACIRWTRLTKTAALLKLGAAWAVLTCGFEIGIGMLRGLDFTAIGREINPFTGGLMLYSLIVMLLAPLAAARLRRVRSGVDGEFT